MDSSLRLCFAEGDNRIPEPAWRPHSPRHTVRWLRQLRLARQISEDQFDRALCDLGQRKDPFDV
jgi:hypothetical protein